MMFSVLETILFTFGVNFTNVLRAAFALVDPKSAKKTVKLSSFFVLLGSARAKAACRTLVKLNLGLWFLQYFSLIFVTPGIVVVAIVLMARVYFRIAKTVVVVFVNVNGLLLVFVRGARRRRKRRKIDFLHL